MGMMRRRSFKTAILSGLIAVVTLLMPANLYASDLSGNNEKILSDVVAISGGERAVYAIKKDGTVWAWGGFRDSGLLGNGYTVPSTSPVQMKIDNAKDIASGSRLTLILKKDGTVWATGSNEDGQLGIGITSYDKALEPVQIKELVNVKAIAAESNQSLALLEDGTVWQWGKTDRVNPPSNKPVKVEGLFSGLDISAGNGSAMMLDDRGKVHVWGTRLFDTNPDKLRNPTEISGTKEYTAIATSRQRGAAIQTDGTVWTWNNSKQFPTPGELLIPVKVQRTENARQIVGGSSSSFSIIKKDGTVWTWDSYWDGPSYKALQVKGINDAVDLASSQFSGHYALLENGTVMKWTMELGESSEPKPVNAPIKVVMKGETLSLVIPPIIINNVSYVPLRGVFEPLGATIEWNQGNFTGVVKKDDITIEINTSSEGMKLNGKTLTGELKPISVNYVTMVPLRFLSETLGAEVKWQSDKNTIYINLPK